MKDNFKYFKNHANTKIIGLTTRKFEQLEIAHFELNSLNLSVNSKPMFFCQKLPDIQIDLIKTWSNPDVTIYPKAKEIKKTVNEITKSGELDAKFSMCKKKISNSLKLIEANTNILISNSCLGNLITVFYNYILEYLIIHKFISDENPSSNAIETSFRAMPLDLFFIKKAQEKVDQIEDELQFYELLLQNFTDTSLVEIKIDSYVQNKLGYDLGDIEFYRHIQKEILESKQSLCSKLHFEIDNITKEFTEINNSILELRDSTEQLINSKVKGFL